VHNVIFDIAVPGINIEERDMNLGTFSECTFYKCEENVWNPSFVFFKVSFKCKIKEILSYFKENE
jgi:hypothetical protein